MEPEETTDPNLSADTSNTEDQTKTPAADAVEESKESFFDKAKEEVKDIIDDVKEGFETAKEKVEEVFEKAKDAIEGKPYVADADDQTKQSEAPADETSDLTALKTAIDPAHDNITANGGTITDLGDGLSADAVASIPPETESTDEEAKDIVVGDDLEEAKSAPQAEATFSDEGEAPVQANLGDRPRGGFPGTLASGEPEATK